MHVSQAGKGHPPPFLLEQQQPELWAAVHPQVEAILRQLLAAASTLPALCSTEAGQLPRPVLYSLLGLDVAVEPGSQARAVLLEANAYPAIGSGTMTAVPEHVYTRLVGDMLGVLVSEALRLNGPAADALGCGEWAQALVGGGFREV